MWGYDCVSVRCVLDGVWSGACTAALLLSKRAGGVSGLESGCLSHVLTLAIGCAVWS